MARFSAVAMASVSLDLAGHGAGRVGRVPPGQAGGAVGRCHLHEGPVAQYVARDGVAARHAVQAARRASRRLKGPSSAGDPPAICDESAEIEKHALDLLF